jgi:hypothetical protein
MLSIIYVDDDYNGWRVCVWLELTHTTELSYARQNNNDTYTRDKYVCASQLREYEDRNGLALFFRA